MGKEADGGKEGIQEEIVSKKDRYATLSLLIV
jgi:hypothetical protein